MLSQACVPHADMPLVHLDQLLSVFMRNTALGKVAIKANMTYVFVVANPRLLL